MKKIIKNHKNIKDRAQVEKKRLSMFNTYYGLAIS